MARHRSNSVRLIGGTWRGRRLRFPAVSGLRPTADRRRETLFNWLAGDLAGADCLDLFAGSGALGFEAASRGAARVVMVEASREVVAALSASREQLGCEAARVVHAPAARYLDRSPERFDIVFLDPPFDRPDLGAEACRRLERGWLAAGGLVYLEVPARRERPGVPEHWQLERETRGGDARDLLYRVGDEPRSPPVDG